MKEMASLALISGPGVQIEDIITCNRDKHASGSAKLAIHSRISAGS